MPLPRRRGRPRTPPRPDKLPAAPDGRGESIVNLPRALEMAGSISDSTRRRDPTFPEPVVLARVVKEGPRKGQPARIGFVRSEVEAWVLAKIAAGRGAGGEAA